MKNLKELVRPNIWALKPYSCARDEFRGTKADVFIDANENPFSNGINRYPDPLQEKVKQLISPFKSVPAENIFLGNEDQFTKCGIKNTAAMNKKAQEYLDSYGFNYIDATKVIDD